MPISAFTFSNILSYFNLCQCFMLHFLFLFYGKHFKLPLCMRCALPTGRDRLKDARAAHQAEYSPLLHKYMISYFNNHLSTLNLLKAKYENGHRITEIVQNVNSQCSFCWTTVILHELAHQETHRTWRETAARCSSAHVKITSISKLPHWFILYDSPHYCAHLMNLRIIYFDLMINIMI